MDEAILWLASQMKAQHGLEVYVDVQDNLHNFEHQMRLMLFQTVRELLFNIVKHAETSEAAVDFQHNDSHLLVTVSDHGAGFDSEAVMSNPTIAHGLLIIRHRLSLLGCNLEVKSQPGKGTEVIIEVPYENTET